MNYYYRLTPCILEWLFEDGIWLSSFLSLLGGGGVNEAEWQIQRKTWCMGPYAGVDYNLTFCPLQGRLQHSYPAMKVDINAAESI